MQPRIALYLCTPRFVSTRLLQARDEIDIFQKLYVLLANIPINDPRSSETFLILESGRDDL